MDQEDIERLIHKAQDSANLTKKPYCLLKNYKIAELMMVTENHLENEILELFHPVSSQKRKLINGQYRPKY